jgi:signal peptidase I
LEELEIEPTASTPQTGESAGWGRFFLDILETLLLSAALFLVINALSARVRVEGFSMEPTLHDGEFVLVNRLAYRFEPHQRGDIVVFHSEIHNEDLIKRIIGLPGDTVKVERGVVYVNGEKLTEPYIAAVPQYSGTWVVPDNDLFVLGDNRNDSSDSHQWGMLPFDQVIGKAILIYWPFNQLQLIDHYNFAKAIQ